MQKKRMSKDIQKQIADLHTSIGSSIYYLGI